MKLVLINPPFIKYVGIKESGGHSMPLSLLYVASYLRQQIPDLKQTVLDAEAEQLSYEEIEERLKKEKPDAICFTCPTPAMNQVLKIAEMTKKINPNCIVLAGGMHPTAFPRETAELSNVDFAILGEGELTICELIQALRQNRSDFRTIEGISFKDPNGKIVVTKMRDLIADLDILPFPARDLVNLELYHSAPTKKVSSEANSMAIMTSRGCVYDCIYCISKSIWRRRIRYRSAKKVADELEECVKKFGAHEFNFYDDLFIINEERVRSVCEEILKRKLDISWVCFGKANTVKNLELLKLMKQAGCKKVSMGLESGSQMILDNVRKQATLDDARRAVQLIKKSGMEAHASFMFGNLGETEETMQQTIRFAKELNLDNATFFIASPYPGTDLYYIAKERGFIKPDVKWEDFAPLHDQPPILVQDTLPYSLLIKYQKKAFREFYFTPKMILRKLMNIRSIHDLRTLKEGLTIFMGILQKKEVSTT